MTFSENSFMNRDTNFSCTFLKNADGTVILESADREYLRLIGRRKCGKNISEIYREKYAGFIMNVFDTVAPGSSVQYIRNDPDNLNFVTAVRDNNRLRCVGVPVENMYRELAAHSGGDHSYIGSVVAEDINGDYVIRECTDRLTLYFSAVVPGASLMGALKKHLYTGEHFIFPKFYPERPVEFFAPLKRKESSQLWFCKINILPFVTKDSQKIILSAYRSLSYDVYCANFCELTVKNGTADISRIDQGFAQLLAEEKIHPEELCGDVFLPLCENTNVKRKIVKAGINGEYTLYAFPTGTDKISVTAVSTPKPVLRNSVTVKEFECLTLAARGNTSKYIAHLMGITEGTVKKTLHNGFVKLGISSRAELIEIYNRDNKAIK